MQLNCLISIAEPIHYLSVHFFDRLLAVDVQEIIVWIVFVEFHRWQDIGLKPIQTLVYFS